MPVRSPVARVAVVVLCLGLLAGLGRHYCALVQDLPTSWRRALADPQALDGETLVFTLHRVHRPAGEAPQLFRVEHPVPLLGAPEDLRAGETVSVRGRFDAASGAVEVLELQRHPRRRAKGLFSLLGLVAWALSLPLWLRLRPGGLGLRGVGGG